MCQNWLSNCKHIIPCYFSDKEKYSGRQNSPKSKVSFHLKLCRIRKGNWDSTVPLIKLILLSLHAENPTSDQCK